MESKEAGTVIRVVMKTLIFNIIMFYCLWNYADDKVLFNEKTWSENNITITCRLAKENYFENEFIMLEIIFLNNSENDIYFFPSNRLTDFTYSIKNIISEKEVPLTLKGLEYKGHQRYSRGQVTIEKRGGTYTYSFPVKSFYDLSLLSSYSVSVKGHFMENIGVSKTFEIHDIFFRINEL